MQLSKIIAPAFHSVHPAIRRGANELVLSGGRGSGKSSYASVELVLQLIKHPDCHALVMRKVGATLRTSVYAQVVWAIGALGLTDFFRCTLSPMECTYLPTGQKILFFGMDDAGKLKSLKMPKGYVGIVWFEELDQFESEEVRSAEQSVFRGGSYSLCIKSFNPPADSAHWANLYAREQKPGKLCHHSTYLEVPQAWLGERFLGDAEHLKSVNPTLYRHEYLGQCVDTGDKVFPNVRLESIDPGRMDRPISGVDWGWWPDPWAFNRVCYHPGSRTLYIFDELRCHRAPNRDTAAMIAQRIGPGEVVIADCAEEKSIADYRSYGINCRPCKKGAGSVAYSMKWLQSLDAIVIDPGRCPETAKEFLGYGYCRGEYPDENNHHIDAVRYATGHVWRRGG